MTARQIPGAFHARDGWHFKRNEGGTVTIWAGDDGPEAVFEANTWASIVASVAASGETGATYRQALAFHEGNLP